MRLPNPLRLRAPWLALAGAAQLAACYDTPLIADDDAAAGEATGGRALSGASGASGGEPASAGASGAAIGGDASPSAPSAAGAGGEPPTSTVSWLTLAGDQAPSTDAPNDQLGIQGTFYAYKDDCAELDWDESTRCASGKLCDPNLHPDAWGMAIGFDFRNTGANGSPADTKQLWNPDDVGALGVAWRVTGKAPGLQLWVLNMAPRWEGQCNAMTCEIEGPPDGVAEASLQGELRFDAMEKDYWGGAGERYTFDRAAVHALQFKLPAIRVRDAEFDFCVEALGVVR